MPPILPSTSERTALRVERYLYATPEQMACLRSHDALHLDDLFVRVREWSHAPPTRPDGALAIHKRSMLGFLNAHCRKVFFDVKRALRAGVVYKEGVAPDEMFVLARVRRAADNERAAARHTRDSKPSPGNDDREHGRKDLAEETEEETSADDEASRLRRAYNGKHLTFVDALGAALGASLDAAVEATLHDPPPVFGLDLPPDELHCPIGLHLFRDPVRTPRGGTAYERATIEAWVVCHGTHPRTGEPLEAADLVPDDALRARCEAYRVRSS
jgi:hypothetical protein